MTDSSPTLSDALDTLAAAATTAGIDPGAARAEGEALAATVAEAARGAFVDWSAQTGRASSAEEFMDAASRGRRFRSAPTPTMGQLQLTRSPHAPSYARALADVAFAASSLGEENPRTVGNAATAAAAQLGESAPGPLPGAERQPVPGVGDEVAQSLLAQLSTIQRKLAGGLDLSGLQFPPEPGLPGAPAPGQPVQQPVQAAPAEPAPPVVEEEPEPEEDPKTVEELLAELDTLVGLADVKAEIHRQAAVLRVEGLRQQAGLKAPTITRHMIFNGNPGTGKTTVARLVAGIYRALGLLSKGQLIEVDRSELVAGYLGQTAMKTADVVKSAEGGVLFIDEAYALAGDQYGQEAVDTLVKEMEDKRDDLVVIVAGYPVPMEVFVGQNPGLASRFRTTIDFADYADDELADIFGVMARSAEYDVDDAVLTRLREILAGVERGPTFGNARYVRNVLEAAIGRHAWRLREIEQPTLEQLRTLVVEDLQSDTDPDAEPEPEPEPDPEVPTGPVDWPAADPGTPPAPEEAP
ncbi:AAA family ATPase [Nocardioides sp. W7]|uniref:AAA family ATPase n=1 Tax=Nocardioides sp. W7 TaxID=2931390 RepID=UPI001FD61923|nr:AAA family ATPase [Nocardioides sp. W7]